MTRIRTEKEERELKARKLQAELSEFDRKPTHGKQVDKVVTGTCAWSHYERLGLV